VSGISPAERQRQGLLRPGSGSSLAPKAAPQRSAFQSNSLTAVDKTRPGNTSVQAIKLHVVEHVGTMGYRALTDIEKAALRAGILDELAFLKEQGISIEVDFVKTEKRDRNPGDIDIHLVDPKISPSSLAPILAEYVEKPDDLMKGVRDHLASQHGARVGVPGRSGAILVPVGAMTRDIGSRADIGGTEQEVEAAQHTMGTALSRRVLHEIGHELGLGHAAKAKPQPIMIENLEYTTTTTKEEFVDMHLLAPEKVRLVSALKRRLENTK
jgi:hypothetical protein